MTAYGNLDVSFDASTKDAKGTSSSNGNSGVRSEISAGCRRSRRTFLMSACAASSISDSTFNFVYQLEAGFDISATPSNKQSNSNLSNQVNGALVQPQLLHRTGLEGLGRDQDRQDRRAVQKLNGDVQSVLRQIGDYSVMMGNTGGDNRVEFGTRLSHAIWYESPNLGGFQFNALFAPGQNRSNNSDNSPRANPIAQAVTIRPAAAIRWLCTTARSATQ